MLGSKFQNAYLQIIKEDIDFNKNEMQNDEETAVTDSNLKKITFVTSDEVLIDALNSGVEEVVLFTNAKDETTGEDTVVEVKFGKDSFGELAIEDMDEEIAEEDEEITEEDEEITEEDEEITEEDEEIEECGDSENNDSLATEDMDEEITEEDEEITEEDEEIAVECSEWLEDGVCVKCQNPECDGSCTCDKCGKMNCIGDCK